MAIRLLAGQDVADPASNQGTGTFVSVASLLSFSASSAVITIIWKVLKALWPESAGMGSLFVPLAISGIVGIVLLLEDLRTTQLPTKREKAVLSVVIKVIIMIVNIALLTAAVVGIDTKI